MTEGGRALLGGVLLPLVTGKENASEGERIRGAGDVTPGRTLVLHHNKINMWVWSFVTMATM